MHTNNQNGHLSGTGKVQEPADWVWVRINGKTVLVPAPPDELPDDEPMISYSEPEYLPPDDLEDYLPERLYDPNTYLAIMIFLGAIALMCWLLSFIPSMLRVAARWASEVRVAAQDLFSDLLLIIGMAIAAGVILYVLWKLAGAIFRSRDDIEVIDATPRPRPGINQPTTYTFIVGPQSENHD